MKPISSKVISEVHLCKDEIVFKLASQYGIDSVHRLLVDFFCHARAFSKIHPPPPTRGFPQPLRLELH